MLNNKRGGGVMHTVDGGYQLIGDQQIPQQAPHRLQRQGAPTVTELSCSDCLRFVYKICTGVGLISDGIIKHL